MKAACKAELLKPSLYVFGFDPFSSKILTAFALPDLSQNEEKKITFGVLFFYVLYIHWHTLLYSAVWNINK